MGLVPDRFEGKTAVVTGSTRGIGAGIAKRLGSEDANVVITGRTVESGQRVAESIQQSGGEGIFVETDVSRPMEIKSLFQATIETFGGIDVLVNNAAIQTEESAEQLSLSGWQQIIDVNFRGYWLCAKEAYNRMDTGAIVNISSNHAKLTMPRHFPYNAVKAGINGMTRSLALDFGPQVRVNTVSPGWVAVDRTVEGMSEEERRRLESIHPAGRIGEPEDVAGAVAFLASEDADYVTGADLLVDGGRTAVMEDRSLPDYVERSERQG